MSTGKRRVLIVCALATSVAGVLLVEPALAQTSDIGRNVGQEVRTWATALLLGIAGLVAIPVLAKRDVNGGLVLVLLVILVGGFVFAQGSVRAVIDGLWRAIGG
jgi:cobalamin synthase